ncbi:MAG: I78 family peptidase inhibitor [Pseudomonadota bacterium]|nr:I78 family peptidase inhibitor [Pseudomonadota bacterium]
MRLICLLPLLALSACATPLAEPVGVTPAGACRDDSLASFVGQPATQQIGAQLLDQSNARLLRWVAKGMMVTMDFNPARLTVYLDAAGRVERASCG